MTDELTLRDSPHELDAKYAASFVRHAMKLTLREKVLTAMVETAECAFVKDAVALTDAIATILEDTGSPAHMRVAAELRGE